jgi:hypothetical protein
VLVIVEVLVNVLVMVGVLVKVLVIVGVTVGVLVMVDVAVGKHKYPGLIPGIVAVPTTVEPADPEVEP